MDIKIESATPNKTLFERLACGDVFKFNGSFYIKLAPIAEYSANAVRLKSGIMVFHENSLIVEKADAHLVVFE